MATSRLQRDLPLYNQWWRSGEPPQAANSPYREEHRSDYEYHLAGAREEQFYALVGPTGSGKTATLYQLVHDLIVDDGVPAEHIAYVPLENPLYPLESDQFIVDVYEWYSSYIRRRTDDPEAPTYLLFDDIHRIDGWANQVRTVLDRDTSAHVVVTLPTEIDEIDEFRDSEYRAGASILLPPKFYDFIQFSTESPAVEKSDFLYPLRDAVGGARDIGLTTVIDECLTLQDQVDSEDKLSSHVGAYLSNSGFRGGSDQGLSTIKQRLELALYRDVQQLYQIEHPGDLYTLCVLVAQDPLQEFRLSELTEQLDTDRRTIQKYLDILEEFLILSPSYKYDYQRHRSLRMYLRDPRYVNALTMHSNTDSGTSTEEHQQKLVHSIVYDHLRRLSFYLNDHEDTSVTYWKEGGDTVEFIVEAQDTPIPVALTTRRGEEAATSAVQACLKATDAPHGVVAGEEIRRPYQTNESILHLPLWLLLYLC